MKIYLLQMTSRENRRAQINDILQHFDDDITRLTRLNVRIFTREIIWNTDIRLIVVE